MRNAAVLALDVYRRLPFRSVLDAIVVRAVVLGVRLRRGSMFVHEANGLRINIDIEQRIDSRIYFTGTWEPETVETARRLLPPGGVAVDVGANIGFVTLVMAGIVGPAGRVIAFEPADWTFARLQANLALNATPQVTVVQAGLSDTEEVCPPADIPVGYRLDGRVVTRRQSIRLATLDGYLAQDPVDRLDFIKCDTDGFETRVVQGALETLRRFRPAIDLELYQGTPADSPEVALRLLNLLASLGYGFHRPGDLAPHAGIDAVLAALQPGVRAENVVAIHAERGIPPRAG
jgi:FkbM family methyltransferase